ncbi:MAG: sn-glycerol-3-phosphate ABC transporter ATP-binding protein UgpC [Clostridiales bacterium]|nr:sn-glycerol-3-phosphate ABC transporter ATP-binding protein UgpC [Clostridiales bacterium]
MASVSLKNIYKVYAGNVTAVSDFNLDIEDKEFIVLVGPSGCGKSTTLRMVAGLEEISSGELYIGERLVNDVAPKDRDIAMVFQNYALYPHMTVFDNMAFGLKLRKVPKAEIKARVEENAKVLDIYHLLNRKPKALSGGQRQRVALGRAIVREPKVFLMDEPLSNLDAKLRVAMRTEITKLHQRLQTTFIYVTHDQTEAMTMGTRIVVMKDGFIQQVDSPQNLYDYPANLFVAGFIGSPQMNFFDVVLEKEGGEVYAKFGNNKIMIPPSKLAKFADEGIIKTTANRLTKSGDEGVSGREVIMGIRPENIHDEDVFVQAAPTAVVNCMVEVTELMGSETYLYLTTSGKEGNIIARVNPRTTSRAGQSIQVAFDVNHLHFFDKETEQTLLTR